MLLSLLASSRGGRPAGAPVSPFEVNFGLFFWTWVVFLALLFLLKKFAWPGDPQGDRGRGSRPSPASWPRRSRPTAEAKAAAGGEPEAARRGRGPRPRRSWPRPRPRSEKERTAAIEKTRHEQDELLARARREIAAERDKALGDLRREAVDLSLAAASKLIGQRLDSEADRKLVEGYLATLEKPIEVRDDRPELRRGAVRPRREERAEPQEYAELIDAVARGDRRRAEGEAVLMSPRVTKAEKAELLAEALRGAPAEFVRFLQAVVKRGRQGCSARWRTEYQALLDLKLNRVRAAVTLARPADEALRKKIAARLTAVVGKEVLPHFIEDPAILGGVVVRVGDRVFDGSIRRRMTMLRRQLLAR